MADDWCNDRRPHPAHVVMVGDPYLCRGVAGSNFRTALYWSALIWFVLGVACLGFNLPFIFAGICMALAGTNALLAETVF